MYKVDRFRLREMGEDDLNKVLAWRNLDRIRANMYTDHMIDYEEHRKWFERIQKDSSSVYFIFEYDNISLGCVYFINIDEINSKSYWGFYLGEDSGPRVSGPAMEFIALDFAFERLALRKLCCEVFSFNQRVIKMHIKFGFEIEGCFKKHIWKNEEYKDVVTLAIFKEDWLESRDKLKKLCFKF